MSRSCLSNLQASPRLEIFASTVCYISDSTGKTLQVYIFEFRVEASDYPDRDKDANLGNR